MSKILSGAHTDLWEKFLVANRNMSQIRFVMSSLGPMISSDIASYATVSRNPQKDTFQVITSKLVEKLSDVN